MPVVDERRLDRDVQGAGQASDLAVDLLDDAATDPSPAAAGDKRGYTLGA